MELLYQGGPLFMYPLLLILILVMILLIKGFFKKKDNHKTISLVSSLGLFAIVWGFLGQIIGLIYAFNVIQIAGSVSYAVLAGGLKISFYAPAFGIIIFLIGRLGIIILTWLQKE